MASNSSSLPFLPLDVLGPIFSTGFLTSSLVVAVIIIAVQHSLSSGKNLSAIRVVLTSIFLLNVALFVGGQTASMTVTAVSDACGSTNALLTVADQLARVSSLILGLNIVARIRFDLARYGLYVWTVARLSIGIATIVLLGRENGVVCLPRFNVAAAVLGLILDLLLDFFLIYQAIKLFSKSDEDHRQAEIVVLVSCLSLLTWHLSSIPFQFRVGNAAVRIVAYCIFLGFLACLLALFHAKVPTPAYVVLSSQFRPTNSVIASPRPVIVQTRRIFDPYADNPGTGPKLVSNLFNAFKRDSNGTTSLHGAPTEPDTEPPLSRYAISKTGQFGNKTYGITKVAASTHSDEGSFYSWRMPLRKPSLDDSLKLPPEVYGMEQIRNVSPARLDPYPEEDNLSLPSTQPTPLTKIPSLPPRLEKMQPGTPLDGFIGPSSAVSGDSTAKERYTPRPKSGESSLRTIGSSLVNYPVTSMPLHVVPTVIHRKEVPRKPSVPQKLKVEIPEIDRLPVSMIIKTPERSPVIHKKVFSDSTFKQDENLLALSREVGSRRESPVSSVSSISSNNTSPTAEAKIIPQHLPIKKSSIPRLVKRQISHESLTSRTPPQFSPPPLPAKDIFAPSRIPRAINTHTPIRDRIPTALRTRLSNDLATLRQTTLSPEQQSTVYTGVLALLSEAISDNGRDHSDTSHHVETMRLSTAEPHLSDDELRNELERLGTMAQKSKRTSDAVLSIYSALSDLPPDTALALLQDIVDNPTSRPSSFLSSMMEGDKISTGLQRSKSQMVSEAKSETGQLLNRKLAEFEDPNAVDQIESILVPKAGKMLSGVSLDILAQLEEEFTVVNMQWKSAHRESSRSLSSSSTTDSRDDEIKLAEMTNPDSPTWTDPNDERFDEDDLNMQRNVPGTWAHDIIINLVERSPTKESGVWTGISNNDLVTAAANSSRHSRDGPVAPQRHSTYSHPKTLSWIASRNVWGQHQGVAGDLNAPEETIWAPPVPIKHLLRAGPRHTMSPVEDRTQGSLWIRRSSSLPQLNSRGLWSGSLGPSRRREHKEYILQPTEIPRTQRALPSQPAVSFANQNGLWKSPLPLAHSAGPLWQPSRPAQAEITHAFDDGSRSINLGTHQRTGLWSPRLPSPPTIPTMGLWSRNSTSAAPEIRFHQEWMSEHTVRSISLNKVRDGVNEFPSGHHSGLWKKPPVSSKNESGLWKSRSLPRISLHDVLLPSFPSTAFLDNSPFLMDARSSSAYPSGVETIPQLPLSASYFRVMEFEFPLPPVNNPSPLSRFTSLDTPSSSTSEAISTSRVSVGIQDEHLKYNDPARVHPVFIRSDLDPDKGSFYKTVHDYPVDRLNPVGIGYFNHSEYEAAMASISAAESLFIGGSGYTEFPHESEASGNTLQSRRFSKRRTSSHWKNRSANLSVNLDLISIRNSLRSPTKQLSSTPSSSRNSPARPLAYLSPTRAVDSPVVEEGEVRPLSPNRVYLLRQGIV